jgi:hypothetical protein
MPAPSMSLNPTLVRLRRLTGRVELLPHVTPRELGILALAGAAASMLSTSIRGWGIPGSAVLQGVLPMAAGLAFVPRHGSGSVMGAASLAAGAATLAISPGAMTPSTLARLAFFGVCLDWALAKFASRGTARVWLAFIVGGAAANLLGFAAKVASAQLGLENFGGLGHSIGWPARMASFALCGALAGCVSAMLFFRRPGAEVVRSQPTAEG